MSKRDNWLFKSKFFFTIAISLLTAVGMATCAFSYSWFSNRNTMANTVTGKTSGAYFARGNGSESSPYVINKPIHLYNLAWLQYLGLFKDETYFIIERDLDMTNWILPPIGTKENPFVGHLDGFDQANSIGQTSAAKISNLTISTSFDDYLRHPAKLSNSDFEEPQISGLFGVVGDKNSSITPTISNISINKMEVQAKTNQALTGIVAGYVNGKLDNVLINDSNLNFSETTNKLTGYDYISKYTSVGYCEPEYETKAVKQETTMYKPYFIGNSSYSPSSTGEAGVGWGGSVDMLSINRRLNYIATVSSNPPAQEFQNSTYNVNVKISEKNKEPYWKNSTKMYLYLKSGTIMPLNIDKDKTGLNSDEEITVNNWHTNSFYQSGAAEYVLSSNTGYMVGANYGTSGAIRSSIHELSDIYLSQGYSSKFSMNDAAYSQERMQVLTIDAKNTDSNGNPQTYRIVDGKNKQYYSTNNNPLSAYAQKTPQDLNFVKYEDVLSNFSSIMDSKNRIHGFHFMNHLDNSLIQNDSTTYKITSKAQIDGASYENYEFVKGGLNFTVHKKGYITSLLGAFYGTSQTNSLYDFFKIERNANNIVTEIKRIKRIYEDSNSKIVYEYYDDTAFDNSRLELKFDFMLVNPASKNNANLIKYAAYYFEFPVSPGDYLIGCAKSESSPNNAYLMYLDIGANADGEASSMVDRTKVFELLTEISEAFTFPTDVEMVNFDDAILDKKILCLTIGATYNGKASFNYKGNNETDISLNTSNSDTGVAYFDDDLTILNNSKEIQDSDKVHGDRTIIETERLSYFDYKREDGSKQLFTFSRTHENDSYSETTAKQYSSTSESTTFLSTSGLTLYDDFGEKLETNPEISRPTDFDTTSIVFSMKLLTAKTDDYSIDYLQECSFDLDEASSKTLCNILGYDFEINNNGGALSSNDYKIISKNDNYSLKINSVSI